MLEKKSNLHPFQSQFTLQFTHFAMRYPVVGSLFLQNLKSQGSSPPGLLLPAFLNSYNEACVNLSLYVLTFYMLKIPRRIKVIKTYFIN